MTVIGQTPVELLLGCTAVLFGLSVLSITIGRRLATPLVYGGCLLVCLAGLAIALGHLLGATGGDSTAILPLGLPWVGARFRLDALASVFLVVVNLGAAAASLYAIGYGRHEPEPRRVLPFYPAFLAAMNLVILADDAFSFLVAWEVMSLSSWALVMAHHREADNRRAGYIYLVMASFGALCLLLAFGLMAGAGGGYSFDAMRAQAPPPALSALVLSLVVLGAGSKAGLVPLHVWLPLAHPAAPSHVSALMSGVMTKVAVYAFVRIVFDLLGPPAPWWSLLILTLGGVTTVLGILYALMQTDLKRMLAYSTVENVGIIFIGLGLGLAFKAQHMSLAAALAVTAALFHVFNHSLFKSLLFFGAGAVQGATGERDMERLGGLIGRMPQTALAFLVGCVAISALPPLNGFASEWLAFQAILLSPQLQAPALKIMVPAVGALLALAAALTAAAFVRTYGIAFLGRPRSAAAETARETDRWSLAAMFLLAALCLLAGVLPGLVIDALAPAVGGLVGAHMPNQMAQPWLSIVPVAQSRSSYNGLLVLVFITASASLAAFTIHRLASRAVRRAPAWDGGYPEMSPATQYTAGSFAQPIRRVFASIVFRARDEVTMPPPGDLAPARFRLELHDPVWETLYAPIAGAVGYVADRLNHLQFLTIRVYLSLVFLALVGLLLVLAVWI
jgi:formate hydrogenlyase subunit 3/multisubunit Na+/H+ antiporter MnhD subunit